jgi:hypothetical protein
VGGLCSRRVSPSPFPFPPTAILGEVAAEFLPETHGGPRRWSSRMMRRIVQPERSICSPSAASASGS